MPVVAGRVVFTSIRFVHIFTIFDLLYNCTDFRGVKKATERVEYFFLWNFHNFRRLLWLSNTFRKFPKFCYGNIREVRLFWHFRRFYLVFHEMLEHYSGSSFSVHLCCKMTAKSDYFGISDVFIWFFMKCSNIIVVRLFLFTFAVKWPVSYPYGIPISYTVTQTVPNLLIRGSNPSISYVFLQTLDGRF